MLNEYLGLVGLVIGWVLGVFGPYILICLKAIIKEENWRAGPAFKPSYLATLLMVLFGHGVFWLVKEGAWAAVLVMNFNTAVAVGIGGQKIAREVLRIFERPKTQ